MMDRKKAAEYFVVGWVKGWTLRTYLTVLADGGAPIEAEAARALYPWLPDKWGFDLQRSCRTHLAAANRLLSDALWDATSDRARLALAPRIEALVCRGSHRDYVQKVVRAADRDWRRMVRYRVLASEVHEHLKRAGGHHWKVCK